MTRRQMMPFVEGNRYLFRDGRARHSVRAGFGHECGRRARSDAPYPTMVGMRCCASFAYLPIFTGNWYEALQRPPFE